MQTVGEAEGFRESAHEAGMSDDEIDALVTKLAANPESGDIIPGTGGCRKLRWALPGMGKRRGCRLITFFSGRDLPVWLLTAFAKGTKVNLSQAERNCLAKLTKEIVEAYRDRVVPVNRGKRRAG